MNKDLRLRCVHNLTIMRVDIRCGHDVKHGQTQVEFEDANGNDFASLAMKIMQNESKGFEIHQKGHGQIQAQDCQSESCIQSVLRHLPYLRGPGGP